MAAIELASTSSRAPVTSPTNAPPPDDDLRNLVLDWVAEERESRWHDEELEEEQERRKEMEFDARFTAHMIAQEHELANWEKEKLVAAFLEVETRREEMEGRIDPLTDDPELVEARWVEFDEWADQRYQEMLGPQLIEEIFGEDDE